jgi:hypothetical protein
MIVARTMMMQGNLQAMDRWIKLTSELDRYHGFFPAQIPWARDGAAPPRLAAPEPLCDLARPRRFLRRDRAARGPDGKTESPRKWRRNGLKRLNPRPEMVGPRRPRTHKMWHTGARLTARDSG